MRRIAMFEKIKGWYETGRWSIERVRMAVVKNAITKEQFEEITGTKY